MRNTNTQPKVFEWNDEYVIEIVKDLLKGNTDRITDHKQYVENMKADLINKEKQQPIEDRIVVDRVWKAGGGITVLNNKPFFAYHFNANAEIPKEKHEAIKQAIESVLNDAQPKSAEESIPTIERQYHSTIKSEQGMEVLNPIKKQDTKEDNPDWEILTFINPNIVTDVPNGNVEKYNSYAVIRNYPIHSVRRKSDNEVFTIGDVVNCDKCPPSFSQQVIGKFQIADKGFIIASCAGVATSINNISKKAPKEEQKPVLFTTEDGVDVIADQIFSRVMLPNSDEPWKLVKDVKATNELYYTANIYFKNFSTKEAAEQYILENKPCLSYQEIMNGLWSYMKSPILASQTLKHLAKSKTNQ